MRFAILIYLLGLADLGNPSYLASLKPAAAGAAEPESYYYPNSLGSGDFGDGSTTSGWQPENFNYGTSNVISVAAGTCTRLGVFCNSNGAAFTFKVGLYNASGALVVQATSASVSNTGAKTWVDVTISQSIATGTYAILVSGSTSDASYGYDTGTDGVGISRTYAASMADPHGTLGLESGTAYGVRMYVGVSPP